MRVTAQRLRKHGAPVAIVFSKSGELRYTARTADQRNAARVVKQSLRDMNGLNEALTQRVKPVIVEQKPVKVAKLKFTITKVAKPFRTGESGNKRVTMWKVESKGIRKYFVSRKAAQHFVKAAKAVA
jgi:GR25 family glycosyltransferase involved in LPS biosynthesis